MNATLHDPATGELLAEVEYHLERRGRQDGRPWQCGFTVIEEHRPLETGPVTIKLEDGWTGLAVVTSLVFPSRQLRRSGTLMCSGPLERAV